MKLEMKYPPKIQQKAYAKTLEEQRGQLENDDLTCLCVASRQLLSTDPYRPIYDYVSPESNLDAPNGFCYW